ncbi:MAG: hypothetical protein NTX87_02620 [Planctomycetota bacterium]|nr:hypothetical protein [Planctomycetota bacterium]
MRCFGVVIALAVLAAGCGQSVSQCSEGENVIEVRCAGISNRGIGWGTDFFGTSPKTVGENEAWVRKAQFTLAKSLLKALDDPERWVAAHVLLTFQFGDIPKAAPKDPRRYFNGLQVVILPDGKVAIDPAQRAAIRDAWYERLGRP